MPRNMASATLSMGMVKIPFGIAKASVDEAPDMKTLCECGSRLGPLSDDDGNKVACKSDDCDRRYSWYNAAPGKGFPLGDEMIPLDADDIERATEEPPVDTGVAEKVVPVKSVLGWYAIEGNYYLTPEDEYEDHYGVLVNVLEDQDWAILTYLQMRSKTRRYAIISKNRVLMALQLQDKKPLTGLEFGADDTMEEQAAEMLERMAGDDPDLPDVEGKNIKEMIRSEMDGFDDDESDEAVQSPEIMAEQV